MTASQEFNGPVYGDVAGRDINHYTAVLVTHQTVVQQPPFALQAPPSPPASRRKHGKTGAEITPAQKELLTLMKPLPAHVRIQVLDYMRSEFGTGMVMELEPRELHRTRQQVLDARRSAGI
jgi:hypothetical protein